MIARDLAAPEREFAWQEDEQIDKSAQANRLRGLMRLNEGRKILGFDPDPSPAAGVLMVMSGAGLVPIDADTLTGKKSALDAFRPPRVATGFGASGQDAENRVDGASDAVGKFDEAQPRDARGRWAEESVGTESGKIAERAAFKLAVLRTVIGGAIVADGVIASAASAGTVPAGVRAAV